MWAKLKQEEVMKDFIIFHYTIKLTQLITF